MRRQGLPSWVAQGHHREMQGPVARAPRPGYTAGHVGT